MLTANHVKIEVDDHCIIFSVISIKNKHEALIQPCVHFQRLHIINVYVRVGER